MFRQGKRVEPKVQAVLNALTRMGYVASNEDSSRFRLRELS
jgi:DNA-binding IclR family transcriptional regulator